MTNVIAIISHTSLIAGGADIADNDMFAVDANAKRRELHIVVQLAVIPVLFFAFFTQGISGFGSALISMPLLVTLIGLDVAAPLFAAIGIVSQLVMLIHYRESFTFREIWRLLIGMAIGIPLGVFLISQLPEALLLRLIGIIVLLYALYTLSGLQLPPLQKTWWGYAFGVASGLMGGAYNVGGPPCIIYGTMQGWDRERFKSNIQAAFLFSTVILVLSHALAGHYTTEVWQYMLLGIPPVVLGLILGWTTDKFISPERFRKLVLVLLLVLALTMVF